MPSPGANADRVCNRCGFAEKHPRYAGPAIQSAGELEQAIRRRLDRADGGAFDELWDAGPSPRCLRCGAQLDTQRSEPPAPSARSRHSPYGSARWAGLDLLDQDFLATADQQTVLAALLDATMQHTPATTANAQLFDHERHGLYIAAQVGCRRAFLDFFDWVGLEGSACATVAATGMSVMVSNVVRSRIFNDASKQVMLDARLYAVQSIPLLGSSGDLLGVFSCHYPKTGNPSHDVAPLLHALAEAAAWSLRKARQEGKGEVT